MLGCVVLNYNDYPTTSLLLDRIRDFKCFNKIVVVDGASTDDSYTQLTKYSSDKVMVIKADRNGGYGYGNNIGIRTCKDLGLKYVLIANPDVVFTEQTVVNMLEIIDKEEKCVAISPRMKGREPAMRILSPWIDVWASFIFVNAVIKPRNYKSGYYSNNQVSEVDVLPGSLVMFDVARVIECGLYDERVFLYHEEYIMAVKFRKKGYRSLLDMNDEYIHNHSVTVSKVFKNPVVSKRIALKSHRIYLEEYLDAPFIVIMIFYCLYPFVCLESWMWGLIKWMNCQWKRKKH